MLVLVVAGPPGHLEGFLEGPCALGSPLHVAPSALSQWVWRARPGIPLCAEWRPSRRGVHCKGGQGGPHTRSKRAQE